MNTIWKSTALTTLLLGSLCAINPAEAEPPTYYTGDPPVTFSSGSTTIWNTLISSNSPLVTAEGTASVAVIHSIDAIGTVTNTPAFLAQGNSTVTVSGSIGVDGTNTNAPALLAQDNAIVTVTGGQLLAQGSGNGLSPARAGIRLLGNAQLILQSGTIEGGGTGSSLDRAGILAQGQSHVNMYGGNVIASGPVSDSGFAGILAADESQVNIYGGDIDTPGQGYPDLQANESAVVTIYGSHFNYPFGAIEDRLGTLSGTLLNGQHISWYFARDTTSTIILKVPEPSSLALAAVGSISLMTIARRRNVSRTKRRAK